MAISAQTNRIYFLDNLRTFLIFLVVLYHAGLVYESSGVGAFFWIVDDPATNDLAGIINLIVDIFIMPTMFFISGFFAPRSLQKYDAAAFLKSRFRRLILPWGVAILALMPLYKVMFLYSRNMQQESWLTYFHVSNGIFSQSWLWFLPILFLFDALFVLLSKTKLDLGKLSFSKAIGAAFIVGGLYSFGMDVLGWQGWTKTALLDFQNERILIYFLVFLLGAICYKQGRFSSTGTSKNLYYTINALAWLPITVYLVGIIYRLINPNTPLISAMGDAFVIRFSFVLSLLALMYLTLQTFRFYVDKQGALAKALSQNSYGVYIIHMIVMGALALLLLNMQLPSLAKYVLLVISTYVVSNLLVYVYRITIKTQL